MTTRCSYGVVDTIEREGVDCIVIYFDGTEVIAFPPDHLVLVVGHVDYGPESAKVYQ
jgi:hypothetical protein